MSYLGEVPKAEGGKPTRRSVTFIWVRSTQTADPYAQKLTFGYIALQNNIDDK